MIGIQIIAFIFCFCGLAAAIAATASNEWKVTSRASSVITATWVFQGLWMNCAGNALGAFHCRPHLTIFKVEGTCNLTGTYGELCALQGGSPRRERLVWFLQAIVIKALL